MRKILILMLLPSTLLAGGFKVIKPQKPVQPPGTVERVSKRTANSKTLEIGHIGSGVFATAIRPGAPLHYLDATGTWQEYKYDEKSIGAKGKGKFDKEIDVGKFKVKYSTASPGKFRYEGLAGHIEFTPAFDGTQVRSEFEISETGIKATYILTEGSPHRLAWGVDATAPLSKLLPPVAWTEDGDSVGVEAILKADSLVYTIFRDEGFKGAIYVDPSIQDTTLPTPSSAVIGGSGAWEARRNSTTGSTTYKDYRWVYNTTAEGYRIAYTFDLVGYDIPATVDSAFFYYYQNGATSLTRDTTHLVEGTWTGGTVQTSWYSEFAGWDADSAAWTVTPLVTTVDSAGQPNGWYRASFTTAGKAEIASVMGVDSLRLMAINAAEIRDSLDEGTKSWSISGTNDAYVVIWYVAAHLPGLSTVDADTLRNVQIELYGNIDSTGGSNLTVRGFESFIVGGDSSVQAVASDTGSYTAGAFSHLSPLFLIDTSYVVRAFGINPAGTSRGAWDTLSTATGGSGASLKVDGRTVNRSW